MNNNIMNLKINFEYDGSKFFGSQIQKNKKTVQGELEKILKTVYNESIEINMASRTDKGVHAIDQCANLKCINKIPLGNLKMLLNRKIDSAIYIKNIEQVEDDFHARYSVKSKKYVYKIKHINNYSVFERNYFYYIKNDIDVGKFEKLLKIFVGTHNFDSFRKIDITKKNGIRTILNIDFYYKEGIYYFEIEGTGFLKNMIRIILEESMREHFEIEQSGYLKERLENPNKYLKKHVAKATGLYLKKIDY